MCNAPFLRAVFFLSLLAVNAAMAVEPLNDLTGPWQLLVDDYAIEQKTGLTRTYHPFQKHAANPLIRPDKPWEGTRIYMYGNVLPNETRTGYRMWYHSLPQREGNRLLYAESTDGINWVKPNLGNVLYNGTTDNNIYFQRNSSDHIASLIHTPWDAPDRQYKLMNYNGSLGGFLGAWSPNGIDFVSDPANPLVTGTGDVGNFVYDFHRDEYLGYVKLNTYVNGLRRRCVAITRTPNWTQWPQAYIVIKPDEIDDRWASGLEKTDFYGLCAFPYESMYVGFLWVLRVTAYIDVCQDGPIFVELVTSRDGINWKRQEGDRPPLLPAISGEWDGGMIFTAQHPLVEDGQIKLYYGGINQTHCQEAAWVGGVGLATMRKDGFVSLDANAAGGEMLTRRLLNAAGALHLNYKANPGGSVRVEVLDGNDQVVPGYGLTDCQPLQGDSTEERVTWGALNRLPSVSPIRLRFALQNASLYSFRAAEPVMVMQPPTIVQQPTQQRVAPGEATAFTIAASGEGMLTYRWQKNGTDLADGGHYSGTQTATLTVSSADDGDAATYRCLVSNAGGEIPSAEAGLDLGYYVFSEIVLPGATTSSVAGMSADGRAVCGTSGGRAMIWTALQGPRDLGLPVGAISSAAANIIVHPDQDLTVTVNATTPAGVVKAQRWDGTIAGVGTFRELPRADDVLNWTARGMGTDGNEVWIVGSTASGGDGNGRDAVIYRSSVDVSARISLPTYGHDHSDLHAISDNGYGAGQFQYMGTSPSGGARNGLFYTVKRAPVALYSLVGAPTTTAASVARCISRDGKIMGGWSTYLGGGSLTKPVIWKDPVTLVTVPFPTGLNVNMGEVHALNGDGSVAGGSVWLQSNPAGTTQAFIWDSVNGTRQLASVLAAEGFDLSGWTLQDVTGISADGTLMCGNGLQNGAQKAWVVSFHSLADLAPIVLKHPEPQAVQWGESATLEIEAIGKPPLAYQWQFNEQDITDNDHYAGTTTPSLTVSGLTVELEGEYRCVTTNILGQTASNPAMLRLLNVRPDFDRDGDVDQEDFGLLQSCLSGATVPQTRPECAKALLDGDKDVDQWDMAILLKCLMGPDVLVQLGCEN